MVIVLVYKTCANNAHLSIRNKCNIQDELAAISLKINATTVFNIPHLLSYEYL